MNRIGISQKMETLVASPCTSGITVATVTEMGESASYSAAPEKRLCSEPAQLMLSLFGANSLMVPASKESTAPYSGTKAKSNRQTLSDRLTQSLISAGLVKGITHTSERKQLGAEIRATALWPLDGGNAA